MAAVSIPARWRFTAIRQSVSGSTLTAPPGVGMVAADRGVTMSTSGARSPRYPDREGNQSMALLIQQISLRISLDQSGTANASLTATKQASGKDSHRHCLCRRGARQLVMIP